MILTFFAGPILSVMGVPAVSLSLYISSYMSVLHYNVPMFVEEFFHAQFNCLSVENHHTLMVNEWMWEAS